MVGLLVFMAGFRHLFRQTREDYEWVAARSPEDIKVVTFEFSGAVAEAGGWSRTCHGYGSGP